MADMTTETDQRAKVLDMLRSGGEHENKMVSMLRKAVHTETARMNHAISTQARRELTKMMLDNGITFGLSHEQLEDWVMYNPLHLHAHLAHRFGADPDCSTNEGLIESFLSSCIEQAHCSCGSQGACQ